ncbi:Uncharacterised protein [Mycobacteroides abscessus subsp. abscessus]|nr:Uncharacterised protein [Mycobacteroides abscessus subsp. abscessus]
MKERAQAMGGEVSAGFRADGGFRVDAQLPLVSVSSGSEREES